MIKREDLKKGIMVRHTFMGDPRDIRTGIINSISREKDWVANVSFEINKFGGFFFSREDLGNIEIITKETHPEEFL